MPTVDAIRRRDSVARFDLGRVFLFFERLMYISMCYRNVLYMLNCKLLFRLAIVVLLGSCEFNPNVTCVKIHVCSRYVCVCVACGYGARDMQHVAWRSRIAIPHAAGE